MPSNMQKKMYIEHSDNTSTLTSHYATQKLSKNMLDNMLDY